MTDALTILARELAATQQQLARLGAALRAARATADAQGVCLPTRVPSEGVGNGTGREAAALTELLRTAELERLAAVPVGSED